jgi:two-component system, OmpR family, sensor kinase
VSTLDASFERPRITRWWPEAALVILCCFWLYLMAASRGWDIPLYLVYVSVGVVYGLRMWPLRPAVLAIVLVVISTGGLTLLDVSRGGESAAELVEVPLLALFYVTMVLHVRSRQRTLGLLGRMLSHERRMYAHASHELMTPLTVARGEVELLIRHGRPSDDDLARAEVVVLEELQRSEQLTSDLLLSAELTFSERERLPTSADDLVLDAIERWHSRMPGTLRIDAVACGTLTASRHDLSRALDTLLANAAWHAGPDGITRIASRFDSDRVLITVVDEGPPRAERLELGLAVVTEIVESHGGRVLVANMPGRGTSVTIELPAREE